MLYTCNTTKAAAKAHCCLLGCAAGRQQTSSPGPHTPDSCVKKPGQTCTAKLLNQAHQRKTTSFYTSRMAPAASPAMINSVTSTPGEEKPCACEYSRMRVLKFKITGARGQQTCSAETRAKRRAGCLPDPLCHDAQAWGAATLLLQAPRWLGSRPSAEPRQTI